MKKDMTINLSKFESTHPRMLFAKEICALFGSNWLNGWENGKKYYRKTNDKQQVITEAHLSFQLRWANYLISFFYPRMLFAKFGSNVSSGSGENDKVKSLHTDQHQTTDALGFQFWWA